MTIAYNNTVVYNRDKKSYISRLHFSPQLG